MTRVSQGAFHVTSDRNAVLTTLLGSCIAVCARDPVAGLGGMNHFVLPSSEASLEETSLVALRYGSYSIERLINEIVAGGGHRSRLEIKVFGGARMLDGSSRIGERNARFVQTYLATEGLRIAASDLGGHQARKIRYRPATGQVWLKRVSAPDQSVFLRERAVPAERLVPRSAGEIVIFT